jgi:putative CocE/NonD family hydrolase
MMVAMNALPPHSEVVGEHWAQIWEEHVQNEPWLLRWLEEQVDGDYWRHGSLRPDYEAIEAAMLMICGWSDCYRNWPLRTFAALRCPRRLLMGPWGHQWPNVAYPGPRIDYLRECVRWFGQWLADETTGVQDEPPIALYVQQYRPPQPTVVDAPGYWRAEREWPLPGATTRTLYLGTGTLAEGPPAEEARDALEYLATVGMAAPLACMGGALPGMQPTDQRADDAWSLVYTSAPLESDLEVVGYPTVVLHASATAEVAFFSVKLCDVAPDGRSTFVTRGLLNATRRDSLREPEPLVPGRVYELRIELDCCAWVFPAGHRLRLVVAGGDWPNIWPAPLPSTHAIYRGPEHPSRLELPVAPPATGPAPQFAPPPELRTLSPVESSGGAFRVIENVHEQTVIVHRESGLRRAIMPYDATELTTSSSWRLTASRTQPARVNAHGTHVFTLQGIGGETCASAMADVTSDRTSFHVVVDLTITVNGAPHAQWRWTRTIPRRLL